MGAENQDGQWLIKSSGEIKGPFTFDEVVQGLYSKEFALIDEIAKKFSRWKYIRDEEDFHEIINKIKNSKEFRSDNTITNSVTDVLTEDLSDKILSFSGSKDNLIESVKEELHKIEEKIEQGKKNQTKQEAQATSPNIEEDPQQIVKKYISEKELKSRAKRNFIIQLFLIIFIIATGFYFFWPKKEIPLSVVDIRNRALREMSYGDWNRATQDLRKIIEMNHNDFEARYLLSYALYAAGDAIGANHELETLMLLPISQKMQTQVYNLMGIMQIKNFNLEQAQEFFKKSQAIDSQFLQAIYNNGVVEYLSDKISSAQIEVMQALDKGAKNGAVLLSLTGILSRAIHDDSENNGTLEQIDKLLSIIKFQVDSEMQYRQELLIASAYIFFLKKDMESMTQAISKSLTIDPDLTSDHISDLTYYNMITWDQISEWVKQMRDGQPENMDLKTLYGYAKFRGSEKLKGKEILEGLLTSSYHNVSNQILHAYTLWKLGRDSDAKAALQPILTNTEEPLPFYFLGKICLKDMNWSCATDNFNKVLKIRKNDLGAITGLAEVAFHQHNNQQSDSYLKTALFISPYYLPALSLKERMEDIKE